MLYGTYMHSDENVRMSYIYYLNENIASIKKDLYKSKIDFQCMYNINSIYILVVI